LQEPIKDPAKFPWREVTKVSHYWLEVNALSACDAQAGMTKPMRFGRMKPRMEST